MPHRRRRRLPMAIPAAEAARRADYDLLRVGHNLAGVQVLAGGQTCGRGTAWTSH
jgi:hypothetical protein